MEKSERIIIKDPLYKRILVEPEHKKYLDSKELQRLRHIKQTSFVDYVYPNANHTRFSHSLGVYHLMKKILDNNLMEVDERNRETLLIAALFHDIGHGPYSHFWEKMFPNFDHEKITRKILRDKGLEDVADLLEGKNPYYYLISSTIDMDKLDYMARDSYFAGVSYGVAEVDFIIDHTYIKNGKLVIKRSSISSVEDLITQRVNLFKTVYFHKFALELDFLFTKIFQRANELYIEGKDIYLNKHLKAFFDEKETIDDLLRLNDSIVNTHVFEWSESGDEILEDLSKHFINRKKFEVKNLNYEDIDLEKLKEEVSKKYDINYYYSEVEIPLKIIQTPIYVEFGNDLRKLEEVSDLIAFYLRQDWRVKFVIYPRDINY